MESCSRGSPGRLSWPNALASPLFPLLWPERPAVVILGDGGLGMYLGELETAVRLGIDLPIVVLVDGSLSLIKLGQIGRGYEPSGVDFLMPKFADIARGFGATGVRVETIDQTREAIGTALRRKGVTLIEAIINGRAYSGGE